MSKTFDLPAIEPEKVARTKWDHIELWLKENHPTRINKVTMRPEYQEGEKWITLNDYMVNSMLRTLRDEYYTIIVKDKDTGEETEKKASMATTKSKLTEIIESDFSPKVDVFKEYFEALPEAVGHSAINMLANSLTMKDPDEADVKNMEGIVKPSELWPTYFRMWLVACVANFHNDYECENQTMLVLIGKQNDGKTTWLNNLVPKQFNPKYRFCSGIQDPRGKDSMTLLVSMFLVNIDDQLGSITKKDADGIKNLITMPRVTIRLPYDRYTDDHPHRASMCGSLNYTGFLTDPTGNRRYLPFEIDTIDWSYINKVDINQVWAEAYNLFREGGAYKFADDQLKQLEEHNRAFKVPSQEEDLINTYMDAPKTWDQAGTHLMTTTDVELYLNECTGFAIKRGLNGYAIKRYMEQVGYTMKQREHNGTKRVRVWSVIKLFYDEKTAHGGPPGADKDGFIPGVQPADHRQTSIDTEDNQPF